MVSVSFSEEEMKRIKVAFTAVVLSFCMGITAFASTGIGLNLNWKYAGNSRINTGKATLYTSDADSKKNITVAVDAGHGTQGGESVKVLSHPDGTECSDSKDTTEVAVSQGMTFQDKVSEASVNLMVAQSFKDKLLQDGYDVLMIRDGDDVQLDNVARTVLANNKADCHITIQFDTTSSDKGAYYIAVPDDIKSMEPVSGYWRKSNKLGESLVSGLKDNGVKIHSSGSVSADFIQTAYSSIASVVIQLGDKSSDHSKEACDKYAAGLLDGINRYYGF